MKTIILAILFTSAALAQTPLKYVDGQYIPLTPAEIAQQAANASAQSASDSNQAAQASAPQSFSTGIVAPSITLNPVANGPVTNGWDLVIDPVNQQVGIVERNSTRRTDAQVEADRKAWVGSNSNHRAAVQAIKALSAYTAMTNQLAQYDGHYTTLTNLIATADLTKTNQLQNILIKTRQSLDDIHDAVDKMSKVLLQSVGIQQ